MPIPAALEPPLLELNILRTVTQGETSEATSLTSWKYWKKAYVSESGCWTLLENSLSGLSPQHKSPHDHQAF